MHQCVAVGAGVVGDRVVTARTLGATVATALRTLGAHVGGVSLGLALGRDEGAADGLALGRLEGDTLGTDEGDAVGTELGRAVGPHVGTAAVVGACVGTVGDVDGARVGLAVGAALGLAVGDAVGRALGRALGLADGRPVGAADVGAALGAAHCGSRASPHRTLPVQNAVGMHIRPPGQSAAIAHGVHVACLPSLYSAHAVWQ